MWQNEFKEAYFQSLMDMVWRQWTRIGIAGHTPETNSPYTVDPEALLIFSARLARLDQRLYDLIPEWLKQYGALININRLKTLLAKSHWKDTQSLLLILAYATADGEKRWDKLISSLNAPTPPTPLFTDWDTGNALFIPTEDTTAPTYGFMRAPYHPSAKISTALPQGNATLLLRLRAHYGCTARAEIILSLLCTSACSIQELSRNCRFSWGVIHSVVSELACGGIITCIPGIGSRKAYTLAEPDKIRHLLSVGSTSFPDWVSLFDILGSLWSTITHPRLAQLSEATIQHEINRCLTGRNRTALLTSGIPELSSLTTETIHHLPSILQSL